MLHKLSIDDSLGLVHVLFNRLLKTTGIDILGDASRTLSLHYDCVNFKGKQVATLFDFLTLSELLFCCGIVVFASILQVSIGMGFGMLASPLIALVKPELVPGSILAMGLFVAFSGAWRERHNISFNELKLGIVGRIIGSVMAFGLLLLIPDVESFFIIFGVIMLIAIGMTAYGRKIPFSDKSLLNLSIVSGLMGSITAVGAPPMALIYHDRDPAIVRPTLNAFFFAGSVLGLISLGFSGWISVQDFIAAIIFIPAMFVGILISTPFKKLPSAFMSKLLLGLSAVASVLLILRGVL
jgi:uncharacterized membrane protein YfcA